MDQQHDRHTPYIFEGVGRTSRVGKVRVKCLGQFCGHDTFWSESKFTRLCPKCSKRARRMRSSLE